MAVRTRVRHKAWSLNFPGRPRLALFQPHAGEAEIEHNCKIMWALSPSRTGDREVVSLDFDVFPSDMVSNTVTSINCGGRLLGIWCFERAWNPATLLNAAFCGNTPETHHVEAWPTPFLQKHDDLMGTSATANATLSWDSIILAS